MPSQPELGSLPGLLTHTFPNLHARQAFYDGLATRYFPDPADARSSLQYSTLECVIYQTRKPSADGD